MKILIYIFITILSVILTGCRTSGNDILYQNKIVLIDCRTEKPHIVNSKDYEKDSSIPMIFSDLPEELTEDKKQTK